MHLLPKNMRVKQVRSWVVGKFRSWLDMLRNPYVDHEHVRVIDDTGYQWIAYIGALPTELRPYRYFILRLWDSFFGSRYRDACAAHAIMTWGIQYTGYRWSIGIAAGYRYAIPVRVRHLRMGETQPTICLSPPHPYYNGCTNCTFRTAERYRSDYVCPSCRHSSGLTEPQVVVYDLRHTLIPQSIMDIRWGGFTSVTRT
jgi:hypothetical protein